MSTMTDHGCKDQTLVERVKYWGQTNPDTPAFIFWSTSDRSILSRGDVFDLSSKFAYRLTQLDIKPGDVVCISLPNCPQRVVVEFGIHLAGAVSMNGQILRADGQDLINALNKSNSTSIILDPEVSKGAWSIISRVLDECDMHDGHAESHSTIIPSLRNVIFCRTSHKEDSFWGSLNQSERYIYENGKPKDRAVIFTTSGSTGYSKLVPHTHERVFVFALAYNHILNLRPGCKFLNVSPLGWTGGFPCAFLFSGCTRVLIDESGGLVLSKPPLIWDMIVKEKVEVSLMLRIPSVMTAVNAQRRMAADSPVPHKLRKIFTSGQPIRKETFDIIGELTDSVANVYGSTEYALSCSVSFSSINIKDCQDYMIGYPLTGVSMKVVDDMLNTLPPMSRGEILVQSSGLCEEYIGGDASAQESFLPERWFRTGDVGCMRADGCFFAEGRSSDAITRGGYILYPSWLEKELIKCPGVKDVIIVPVPDKLLHQEICACIQPDDNIEHAPSAEDILQFCQKQMFLDKSSSLSFVPKYVVFLKEILKTTTGKTDRKGLTNMAMQQLNL